MPKGYIIGHVTVKNPDAYAEYVERDTPIFLRHGGRFLVRGGQATAPEGPMNERHVVIEFDSYEAALACYNDPDYQAIVHIRKENAASDIIIVEGT